MAIEIDPDKDKKQDANITVKDLDLIGNDGKKEGSGGEVGGERKLGPDDGDMLI